MKTKLKLHKTLPNFAQMQFNLARTYSPKIIAWDWPKLREIEIELKNEKGEKLETQWTNFNAINWHFICIHQLESLLVVETWSVRYFQNMMYSWCGAVWKLTREDIAAQSSCYVKGRSVIIEKASCIFFILLLLRRPKEIGMHMHYCSCNGHGKYNHIIYWSVTVVDGIVVFACALTHARRKHYSNNYTIETMKWLSCL